MQRLEIHLEEDRSAFEPGEVVRVRAEWSLPNEPASLELRAVWNTVGKGSRDIGIEQTRVIESPRLEDSQQIEFTLPSAPYSFSGTLVSLVWALELVALPSKDSDRIKITIAPGATEVVLPRVATK